MCSTGLLEYQKTKTIPPHIARRLDYWAQIHGEKLDELLNQKVPLFSSKKRKFEEKKNNIVNMIDEIKEKEETFHNKLTELLISCKLCNCCEKHKINKPLVFSPWVETTTNINKYQKICSCDCRHVARWICRQHPDYK